MKRVSSRSWSTRARADLTGGQRWPVERVASSPWAGRGEIGAPPLSWRSYVWVQRLDDLELRIIVMRDDGVDECRARSVPVLRQHHPYRRGRQGSCIGRTSTSGVRVASQRPLLQRSLRDGTRCTSHVGRRRAHVGGGRSCARRLPSLRRRKRARFIGGARRDQPMAGVAALLRRGRGSRATPAVASRAGRPVPPYFPETNQTASGSWSGA